MLINHNPGFYAGAKGVSEQSELTPLTLACNTRFTYNSYAKGGTNYDTHSQNSEKYMLIKFHDQ